LNDSADVLVIGAGLSGLMAAVQASQRGLSVTVLEGQPYAGAKFCYSAMGAAAVSNNAVDVTRFRGRNARFVDDALKALPLPDLRRWFENAGVEVEGAPYYGLVRPAEGGPAVVLSLVEALEAAEGELRVDSRVSRLTRGEQGFVASGDGFSVASKVVVLACGGANLPQLGGDEQSYGLASSLGHRVEPTFPALVGVTVAEDWPGNLPGLWMDVQLKLLAGRRLLAESEGSMLFTSGALTGEAVFNISAEVEPALARGEDLSLAVNFHPAQSGDEVAEWLHRVFGERTRELAEVALDYIVPRRLGVELLARQKLKTGVRVMQLDERHRQVLLREMTDTRLRVTGTLGMRAAEGVTGGLSVREVDPRSFASRIVPGLYITGQVLDVAAAWGGFEQHFALASGFVAGRAIEH
jgi:predicted Rossmann fold flavoprotein